jgi:hypothetical protein
VQRVDLRLSQPWPEVLEGVFGVEAFVIPVCLLFTVKCDCSMIEGFERKIRKLVWQQVTYISSPRRKIILLPHLHDFAI